MVSKWKVEGLMEGDTQLVDNVVLERRREVVGLLKELLLMFLVLLFRRLLEMKWLVERELAAESGEGQGRAVRAGCLLTQPFSFRFVK